MQPALDPIWMGPILTTFVALWFTSAMVVFKDRPAKDQSATESADEGRALPESRRPGAHRSVEARRDRAA